MQTPAFNVRALVLCSIVLIAAVVGPITRAGAQVAVPESSASDKAAPGGPKSAVPDVDVALREALENNPDILVAKAKVQEAEAVLNRTRLSVAQQVLSLRTKAENELSRAGEAQRKAAASAISTDELRNALEAAATSEADLEYALGRAKRFENTIRRHELGRILGAKGGDASSHNAPHGPEAATIRKALSKKTSIDLKQVQLKDAVAKFAEMSGVNFVLDVPALDDAGISADQQTDVSIKDAALGAILQAFEDLGPPMRFVVREYGVLLTTDHSRAAEEACRIGEFWQSDSNSEPKP